MALTGRIGLTITLNETVTGDIEKATIPISENPLWTIASGLGANQADRVWSDQRTLTTGQSEDLDLQGTLTGITGAKLFVKLKAVAVWALATNTTIITVSSPATNGVPFLTPAGSSFALAPGGIFLYANPSAAAVGVVAATADLIRVVNAAGASANYRVIVVGTSA